jgi:hypothetical protein
MLSASASPTTGAAPLTVSLVANGDFFECEWYRDDGGVARGFAKGRTVTTTIDRPGAHTFKVVAYGGADAGEASCSVTATK